MLAIRKGRFNIILNQAIIPDSYQEIVLRKGLDVGEVLIEAARRSDEIGRTAACSIYDDELEKFNDEEFNGGASERESDNDRDLLSSLQEKKDDKRLQKFCSLVAELNGNSSESEITLMLMRYACELVPRAVLFSVGREEIFGLGQFGISVSGLVGSRGADWVVRNLRIPLSSNCILSSVVKTSRPSVGKLREGYWDREVLGRIGGLDCDLVAFTIPLICEGRVVFILYGDNYPGGRSIEGVEELIAFAHLAGLILEKIKLSEKLAFVGA